MLKRFLDWLFPERSPLFQVYGGPQDGQWVSSTELDGYYFDEDIYSGRMYHVWKEDL